MWGGGQRFTECDAPADYQVTMRCNLCRDAPTFLICSACAAALRAMGLLTSCCESRDYTIENIATAP